MKVALIQTNPKVGDMPAIFDKMVAMTALTDANLLVFPELTTCGYYPKDLLDEDWFAIEIDYYLNKFKEFTKLHPDKTFVIGHPEKDSKAIGKKWKNALIVIKNGETLGVYYKQLLPTYGIFDEMRHFQPGENHGFVLSINGTSVGFLICEDGWNDDLSEYTHNPFTALVEKNPELIVSINASPSNLSKHAQRMHLFSASAKKYNTPIAYVNQVGGQDEIVYDGASFVLDQTGQLVCQAKAFNEDIIEFTINNQAAIDAITPIREYPFNHNQFKLEQIMLGLRDYVHKSGFKSVVVGSSGGIDSAATIAFSAKALGPENVLAVTMPSKVSSQGSVSDSEVLCNNLGVKLEYFPISDLVAEFKSGYTKATDSSLTGIAAQNIQARIRGSILMAYSNAQGHLLLTTGNKSEVSVGYCTLYGDTNGGLGLLGDLYKTEIFELCAYFNEVYGAELIPFEIINKEPSAELEEDQKDSDNLPEYPVLDTLLKLIIEHNWLSKEEKQEAELFLKEFISNPQGRKIYEKVLKLVAQNEYKRRQMPPVIRIRPRAFGQGRQMPLAARLYPI